MKKEDLKTWPVICKCKSHKDADGGNVVILQRPPHMYPTNRGDTIEVDACIAPFIQELWSMGIWTAGACCGHTRGTPSFCVFPEHEEQMRWLGFEQCKNCHTGCFDVL